MKLTRNVWCFFILWCANFAYSHVTALNNVIESQKIGLNDNEAAIVAKKNRRVSFKDEWDDPNPQYIHTFAAKSFTLNCSVKGIPKPRLTWYKDEKEILYDKNSAG